MTEKMTTGSTTDCDLTLTITKNGLNLLRVAGVSGLLPKTKKEVLQDGVKLKYKLSAHQASFMAMWHGSDIYGISVDIEPEGFTTTMTPLRVQLTDECIEGICAMFIAYEKYHLSDERKKLWNMQLTFVKLVIQVFDKWSAWRTLTAMFLVGYSHKMQLKLLDNITQIKGFVDFEETERIFNIINDKNLGEVQGYKR